MHVRFKIEIPLLCSGANNTLVQPCALLSSGIVAARPIQSVMHDELRQAHELILQNLFQIDSML